MPHDTLNILERLVAFDTVSAKSNLPLIDHVERYLREHGVAAQRVMDETGEKASLLATIGPREQPGIVLSGHTDVVPTAGQPWSSDPFTPRIENGRVYGRGTCDMKGYLAAVLALVPDLVGRKPTRPVHIAFSHDEEVGCKGVPLLIDHMRSSLPWPPLGCIVGEPTSMRHVDGHKGKLGARCTVIGKEGHSALTHETVNAVMIAGRLIDHLASQAAELAASPSHDGFVPPFTSVNVGRIEGGSQLNIVPGRCSFEFEYRTLPDENGAALLDRLQEWAFAELLPDMRRVSEDCAIDMEVIIDYPGFRADREHDFSRLCAEIAGGAPPAKVSYGTEAGCFQKAGIPTVVCGPGDMSVAHKADEYVEIAQLEQAERFLRAVIERAVS